MVKKNTNSDLPKKKVLKELNTQDVKRAGTREATEISRQSSHVFTGWFRQTIFWICVFPCRNKIVGTDTWLSLGMSPSHFCKPKQRWVQGVGYWNPEESSPQKKGGDLPKQAGEGNKLCPRDCGIQPPKCPLINLIPYTVYCILIRADLWDQKSLQWK